MWSVLKDDGAPFSFSFDSSMFFFSVRPSLFHTATIFFVQIDTAAGAKSLASLAAQGICRKVQQEMLFYYLVQVQVLLTQSNVKNVFFIYIARAPVIPYHQDPGDVRSNFFRKDIETSPARQSDWDANRSG